jgi:hypothetical protein
MSHNDVVRSEGMGGWGLILLIAVVAALFSMLSQPEKNVTPPPAVAPLPTPSATAQAAASSAPAASPSHVLPSPLGPTAAALQLHSGFVSAGEICPPTTDHRSALAISVVLRNESGVTERLVGLAPALPVGGLVDKGAFVRSGSCRSPFGKPVKPNGQVMPAGTTVLVTLHLGLPKTCPRGLPVGLNVTLSIAGNVRAEQLSLPVDLTGTRFDTCAKT